ncbi:helix-turn-helix domain-containing protein [Clostridium sp. DSM 100503]|uniref:helix-turn-helix domain-containing protein n=1 Tax=Clostridium sp. DSM 100503 TaxID=2963282 RepID=UPI00214A5DD5|nr:helix-turn-helix transcriptional regulator [Clostridium sp. DSM 100503]MCR1952935.1 helix-turn-helix domain-containing protein [Clostridium sp. DSM 100503]
MTFGDRLKELREKHGLTQEQLAKILNITRPTIAGYETKGKQPDYEKLKILADFFNVSIDYLLGHTDIKNNTKKDFNSDIVRIERARKKMPKDEQENMMKVLEAAFAKYFND